MPTVDSYVTFIIYLEKVSPATRTATRCVTPAVCDNPANKIVIKFVSRPILLQVATISRVAP